jgi:protein-L-isoaspartate(D-aspartate) O-methyltransferase
MVCDAPRSGGTQNPDAWAAARRVMVDTQIAARGVRDARVLDAMRTVPRHAFVPPAAERDAYEDTPLPIGLGQTISQPYIVALMTELARPAPGDVALEVGTGSGYQAAVLSRLVARVSSIELEEALARDARDRLARLGFGTIEVRQGDGYLGWPERAPFDIILVTAAPEAIPPALVAQLKPGGRMVIPVGPVQDVQELQLVEKDAGGRTRTRTIIPVRFVPLRRREAAPDRALDRETPGAPGNPAAHSGD